jgi:hypothetical protein
MTAAAFDAVRSRQALPRALQPGDEFRTAIFTHQALRIRRFHDREGFPRASDRRAKSFAIM